MWLLLFKLQVPTLLKESKEEGSNGEKKNEQIEQKISQCQLQQLYILLYKTFVSLYMCGVLQSTKHSQICSVPETAVFTLKIIIKIILQYKIYLRRRVFLLSFNVLNKNFLCYSMANFKLKLIRMWLILNYKSKKYSEAACLKPLFVIRWNAGCRLVWFILGIQPERHVLPSTNTIFV